MLAAMLASIPAGYASDFVVDELCYTVTDAEAKTVEVSKYDYEVDGTMVRPTKMDVVVPATVVNPNDNQTYRVTSLGEEAFTIYGLKSGWFDYTSVTLPEGLLEIGEKAFTGQAKLTSLTIPGTVKAVRTNFSHMQGLSELTFPASVEEMTTIESGRIKKLTIDGAPTIIPHSRDYITGSITNKIVYFLDNDSDYKNVEIVLTSAVPPTLPQITRIQYKAYAGRTTVRVPEGKSDAYNAAGWNQAEVVVEGYDYADVGGIRYLHDSHRAIGYDVASEINGPLEIPQSVTIGGKAYPVEVLAVKMFEGEGESLVKSVTAITLPEGLKRIERNALYGHVTATEVTIPESVEYLGTYSIRGDNLKKIYIKGTPELAQNSIGTNFELIRFASQTPPTVGPYSFQSYYLMVVAPDIASIPAYREALSGHFAIEKGYESAVYGGLNVVDDIYYSAMDDGNACAIYSDGEQTSVALLEKILIDGAERPLTKLHRGLFNYRKDITAVILPETVKTIGASAFSRCSALTSLQLPSGVEEIGEYAFYECGALAIDVALPSLKSIGKNAFAHSGITSLDLTGAPLTAISEYAFNNCQSLVSITLNECLEKIERYALSGAAVEELVIPASVTDIYSVGSWKNIKKLTSKASVPPTLNNANQINCPLYVPVGCVAAYRESPLWTQSVSVVTTGEVQTDGFSFYLGDTDALLYKVDTDVTGSKIVIPSTVEREGKSYVVNDMSASLLKGKTSVESVVLPSAITRIPERTFYGCKALTSVTIPQTVTAIDASAFNGCQALTSIELPQALESIGESCFTSCKALTTVALPESLTAMGKYAFAYCSNLACDVTLPEGLTSIPENAFNQSGITGLTLGSGVTSVGDRAFYNCNNLAVLKLNEGLTTIGDEGFFNCGKVKEIELPASLATVGKSAFWNSGIKVICHSAEPLTLPRSSMYSWQFRNCTVIVPVGSVDKYVSATAKGWDETNTYLTFDGMADGVAYRADDNEAWVVGVADDAEEVVIKDNLEVGDAVMPVVRIDAPFSGKTQLRKVYVPAAIELLQNDMFKGCSALSEITFGEGSRLQTVGRSAFSGTAIETVELPEGVTELPDGAFSECPALKEITLPASLTSLGSGCFWNSKALTEVTVEADNLSIYDRAFLGCESLVWIHSKNPLVLADDTPGLEFDGCKSLRAASVAGEMIGSFTFDGCEALEAVNISEGVGKIREYAFRGCKSLKRVLLPASLTEMLHGVFEDMSLEEVTCLAVEPPVIVDKTFSDYSGHLCVPSESTGEYQLATGWQNFKHIGDLSTSGVGNVVDGSRGVTVRDGKIIVEGTDMIKVYSLSGALIYSGKNQPVDVSASGIYIVETGHGVVKATVK